MNGYTEIRLYIHKNENKNKEKLTFLNETAEVQQTLMKIQHTNISTLPVTSQVLVPVYYFKKINIFTQSH